MAALGLSNLTRPEVAAALFPGRAAACSQGAMTPTCSGLCTTGPTARRKTLRGKCASMAAEPRRTEAYSGQIPGTEHSLSQEQYGIAAEKKLLSTVRYSYLCKELGSALRVRGSQQTAPDVVFSAACVRQQHQLGIPTCSSDVSKTFPRLTGHQ